MIERPLEDWEYPDPDDQDDDDLDTIECPECGRDVYEDAPNCSCGYYFLESDRRGGKGSIPLGWIGAVIIVLVLLAMLSTFF